MTDPLCPRAPDDPAPRGRAACRALLSAVIAHAGGDARGTAVFILGCECLQGGESPALRVGDAVLHEVGRRLRAVAPAWHRLLRGDGEEFVVIAQGLVDGGAVLAAASRLVHAFDDALQLADLPYCPEVSIGIAFAPQHGARAESLLAAAESGLRDARRGTRSHADRGCGCACAEAA